MIIIKTYWKIAAIALVIVFLLLGIIYVTPLEYSIKVGAVFAIMSVAVAILFGDLAGTFAARRFQEEDVKRARAARLHSLRNEVTRIWEVMKHYQSPDFGNTSGAPKFPVAAFETAFVSGSSSLATSEELIKAVSEYLVSADAGNWLINKYERAGHLTNLVKMLPWPRLSEILNRLDRCLSHELET